MAEDTDHIKPQRLFDLSQAEVRKKGFEPDEEEKQHLRECDQCQRILEVFARQFNAPWRPQSGKTGDAA